MSTPVSNASSYASGADFLQRYDARTIAQLVRDDSTQETIGSLPNDANLLTALQDASGMVESAVLVGNKYIPTDLTTLTGNSANFLKRLVCDLVIRRRPYIDRPVPPQYEEALAWLERLRDGERVFGLQEVMNAGNSFTEFLIESDIETQNFATFQAERFFGIRSNRWRWTP
jgi:phage gp36-like protein